MIKIFFTVYVQIHIWVFFLLEHFCAVHILENFLVDELLCYVKYKLQ